MRVIEVEKEQSSNHFTHSKKSIPQKSHKLLIFKAVDIFFKATSYRRVSERRNIRSIELKKTKKKKLVFDHFSPKKPNAFSRKRPTLSKVIIDKHRENSVFFKKNLPVFLTLKSSKRSFTIEDKKAFFALKNLGNQTLKKTNFFLPAKTEEGEFNAHQKLILKKESQTFYSKALKLTKTIDKKFYIEIGFKRKKDDSIFSVKDVKTNKTMVATLSLKGGEESQKPKKILNFESLTQLNIARKSEKMINSPLLLQQTQQMSSALRIFSSNSSLPLGIVFPFLRFKSGRSIKKKREKRNKNPNKEEWESNFEK